MDSIQYRMAACLGDKFNHPMQLSSEEQLPFPISVRLEESLYNTLYDCQKVAMMRTLSRSLSEAYERMKQDGLVVFDSR